MKNIFHWWPSGNANKQTRIILHRMAEMEHRIMATQAELAAQLKDVLAKQVKTQGEIQTLQASMDVLTTKVTELQALIDSGAATTELADAVAAVAAQAQVVDDQIPDVTPPAPTP